MSVDKSVGVPPPKKMLEAGRLRIPASLRIPAPMRISARALWL